MFHENLLIGLKVKKGGDRHGHYISLFFIIMKAGLQYNESFNSNTNDYAQCLLDCSPKLYLNTLTSNLANFITACCTSLQMHALQFYIHY